MDWRTHTIRALAALVRDAPDLTSRQLAFVVCGSDEAPDFPQVEAAAGEARALVAAERPRPACPGGEWAARLCPACGVCTCPVDRFDNRSCPLHGDHACHGSDTLFRVA